MFPKTPLRLIDLFAGAGGFTLGFKQHFGEHIEPIWANDFNEAAAATYNANFGDHCNSRDIIELMETDDNIIPQADIVIGGPHARDLVY